MKLYRSSSVEVTLPESGEWVRMECLSEPEFEAFKTGLLQALAYVKKHPVNTWLLDFRALDALGEREETWLQVQFFPQLMMLGHEHYIAVIVSEECYHRMLEEVGDYGLKSYNSFIIINTFCQLPEAEDWLRNQRLSKAG
ncbi:hypothetical protein H7F15_03350 [Pontibacter sp. Tf4]|uniref:hypothetical protein n=1 Tax=Pontibacter sp. Tf4 TaxID=2761620 RepID=UPI0016242496|nr:hypothetical protein [Pontibacter sp. Tf4]MBB6610063.1 hypothetical protein [Pontibacter sp. Tf4]